MKGAARRNPESFFSVGNPPQKGFLTQVSEIFQRLDIGVRRFLLFVYQHRHSPLLSGSFYVMTRDEKLVEKGQSFSGTPE